MNTDTLRQQSYKAKTRVQCRVLLRTYNPPSLLLLEQSTLSWNKARNTQCFPTSPACLRHSKHQAHWFISKM